MRTLLAILLLAGPASAATIAPVTTNDQGQWTQNVRNNHDTFVQVCIIRDGTTGLLASDNFGCRSAVQPGESVGVSATLNSSVTTSVSVRAVSINPAGTRSPASADNRIVSRPVVPPPPLAPTLLP